MNAASRVGRNDPLGELREELRALTTILSNAGSTRAEIERLVRSVRASQRDASFEDALLSLLLRNLLSDLRTNGLPERTYYARQLGLIADRL